jgi:uncharacterized repeat protein (TIGR01451 family)
MVVAMAATAHATTPPPGFVLAETLTVPLANGLGTGPAFVTSTTTLAAGTTYKIRASGLGTATGGPCGQADAEFVGFGDPSCPPAADGLLGADVGLAIGAFTPGGSKSPQWGTAPAASHEYTIDFPGQGAPVTLAFNACVPGCYDDNTGSLTVEIFAPDPQLIRRTRRFDASVRGDIVLIGNSVVTCPASAANCLDARQGIGLGAQLNNNGYNMIFVDIDGDPSTFDSSSADLSLPPGATVLYAGLHWTAFPRGTGGPDAPDPTLVGTVRFATPSTGGYTTITALALDTAPVASEAFAAVADVTALVQAGGSGTYTVANVQAATGSNAAAGWALVVAYAHPGQPLRQLIVADGFARIAGFGDLVLPVANFHTPPVGSFDVRIGVVALEGERGQGGDFIRLDATSLSDAGNAANNFFNSTILRLGAPISRNPADANTFGFDADVVSAAGILPNGATSVTINLGSTLDVYFPSVVTSAVDIVQPVLTVHKAVTDVDGGPFAGGDVLEYTITIGNTGNEDTAGLVLIDPIPADTTYEPGSLEVLSGPPGSPIGVLTDAPDTDAAEFDSGGNRVVFRLGAGATGTTGGVLGILAPDNVITLRFRVRADPGIRNDASVGNQATVTATGALTGAGLTILSDGDAAAPGAQPTIVTTANEADLSLATVAAPDPVAAGGQLVFTLVASNGGPSPGVEVEIRDATAANTTFVSAVPSAGGACTTPPVGGTGGIVCTWAGFSAAGAAAARSVVITVRVDPGAPVGLLANSGSVTSATPDPDPAGNVASAAVMVVLPADLRMVLSGPVTAVAGTSAAYTIEVTNLGPAPADAVEVADPTPPGLAFAAASAPCAGGFPCALGALAPGVPVSVTVTFAIPATYGGPSPLQNTATASSATPDLDPANNRATVATTVQPAPRARVILTGAGPGGGPHVRVLEADTGASLFEFYAYDPAFPGGVSVAARPVRGQLVPDIVTGAGPGGGPHVQVFSGADGSVLHSFYAYDPAFRGGVNVAAGDVNGDGVADVVTGAGPGGGPHVRVFDGVSGAELMSFYAYEPAFGGGVFVAAADLDGDHHADIVTGAGPGGGPHVRGLSGATGAELFSFFVYDHRFRGGVRVALADVNGDGAPDLITGAGPGGEPHVQVFDGAALASGRITLLHGFYAYDVAFTGGVFVAGADLDGDGKADIITGAGPGGGPHVRVFDGATGAALAIPFGSAYMYGPAFGGGVFVGSTP